MRVLAECLNNALRICQLNLAAFVFMPEHVHLIVYPKNPAKPQISRFLKALKQPFSQQVRNRLIGEQDPLIRRLIITRRSGKAEFHFWQQGPGYDRNLNTVNAVLAAIDYVHLNPVRRGLCARPEDWLWSSAKFYSDVTAPQEEHLPPVHGLPGTFLL
jgi:putative transposase